MANATAQTFNLSYWVKLLTLLTIWGLAVVVFVAVLPQVLLVGVAAFIAICMNPPVTYFARTLTKGNRLWATILLYILLGLVLMFCILNVLPVFIRQVIDLVDTIPALYEKVAQSNTVLGKTLQEVDIAQLLQDNRDKILSALGVVGENLVSTIGNIFGGILQFATVFSFSFLMVMHAPYWRRVANELTPEHRKEDVQTLASQMYQVATSYINGNLLISLIAGTAATLMLSLLGVPNAVALGVIVAVVDLLPSIGATLAGVIVVTLTLLLTGPADAFIMALFFLAYQGLENITLQPLVYSRALKVQSLLILVAVFLVGSLFGIVGALLAIPLTASLQILVKFIVEKQRLTQKGISRGRKTHKPNHTKSKRSR